ncbi:MAG: aminomethyl-transferring glycine dehydrogenase subunit GcvPB [Candidatus Eremiobacteraeota bacterium]|nr:aminomethyl-transferring glycine dehydrogenase subunit GcvPB [Candidatus Eremiobacteraeota bacterium]MBC5802180.1 aminomethyl-transferring glycine dehydrogenase subunit GcvPB [Candidatus Eremiobacteraeota bacterium]
MWGVILSAHDGSLPPPPSRFEFGASEPLIFEQHGRANTYLPDGRTLEEFLPKELLRDELALPDNSELDVVRHFTRLSQRTFSIDTGFYPLGSCTMKYNPRINDAMANLAGFRDLHPFVPDELAQGALALMHDLERYLAAIFGMAAFSLNPAAGAHAELTALLIAKAYFAKTGQRQRRTVIVPDTAHGTNPASAAMVGYNVISLRSDSRGRVGVDDIKAVVNDETAVCMMTNPNTLGLFEDHIAEIAAAVHAAGGLMYYDGANANALMGNARPGDMGFDLMHLNLHKTFSIPHGGGGAGHGPVGVAAHLVEFLPTPVVRREGDTYRLDFDRPDSIGPMRSFWSNFAHAVRALTYVLANGGDGLTKISQLAVLNANYLRVHVRDFLETPYDESCRHEFVASAQKLKRETGVRALDLAKALLDHGYHAPTIYFPLLVPECLMIEPTETESKATLDGFIAALRGIVEQAKADPEAVLATPQKTVVKRIDETRAARQPDLRWMPPAV